MFRHINLTMNLLLHWKLLIFFFFDLSINNHTSRLLSFQREFVALFLIVILAKLARSALKTVQREGSLFSCLKLREIFFNSSDERTAYVGTHCQFFPISQFYFVYYKISVAGEDTVLKTFCDVDFFTCINYMFYFNCILS